MQAFQNMPRTGPGGMFLGLPEETSRTLNAARFQSTKVKRAAAARRDRRNNDYKLQRVRLRGSKHHMFYGRYGSPGDRMHAVIAYDSHESEQTGGELESRLEHMPRQEGVTYHCFGFNPDPSMWVTGLAGRDLKTKMYAEPQFSVA
jgi:hypothetical protein